MKKLIMLIVSIGLCAGFTACFQMAAPPSSSNSSSIVQQSSSKSSSSSIVESSGSSTESNSSSEAVESSSASEESSSEEQKQYVTITFKQSDCNDIVKTIEKGEALTDIPTPQDKTGYTIVWDRMNFANITENITVNAVATANTYTVTYDANGGTIEEETQEVTFDEKTTLATPIKADYLFNGWTYEGAAVISGEKWTIADDVTLVANWVDNRPTYTVTFVDGTKSTEVEVKKGEDVLADDVPEFVGKTGYTAAWDITDYANIQGDTTVTAIYTANTYTVTYDADGFEIDGTTVKLTYDGVCSALDMTLTREDAIFLGWKYNNVAYTNESVWNVAENVTVTPDWVSKDEVVVSFVDTDGSTINKTIYQGQDLTDIPTPTAKTGYLVDEENWYADAACTQVATFESVQESFTVYAKATANSYTITYNANGGTMSESTQKVIFDKEYTLVTPTHEKAYMRFDGWQDAENKIVSSTGVWTIDGAVSLTAKWTDTRATLTVSFMQAGQETKTYSVKEGESLTEIPTPASKVGYNVAWDRTDFTNITENITVKAVETAKTYTITLNANGGSVEGITITVTYGQEYTLPTPTHQDKAFVCWMYNNEKIEAQGIWLIDAAEENLTIVALWGQNEWTNNY